MFRHVRHATGLSINVADIAGSWPEKLGPACCILSSLCHDRPRVRVTLEEIRPGRFRCLQMTVASLRHRRSIDVDSGISIQSTISPPLSLSLSLSVSRRAPWYPVCNRLRRLIDYRIARCRISGASFSCVDLISIFVLIRMWNVKLAFSW